LPVVASVVFYVAAAVAIIGGVGVISARSPMYSGLSLILTLSQLAILYLLLHAEFIAAAQILIYAGAVMVLFLFVIALLGVEAYPFLGRHLPWQRPLSVALAAVLLAGIIFFVAQAPQAITGGHSSVLHGPGGNVQIFGQQLFTTFFFPFELTAPLLIVAMIGAVALGRNRGGGDVQP
jgi:NADH-quinone oxidoreductase subunit J